MSELKKVSDHYELAKMCLGAYEKYPWGQVDELTEFTEGPTVCYFVKKDETLYFVVRGTDDIRDWLYNIRTGSLLTKGIHEGWYLLHKKIWPKISTFFNDHWCPDSCHKVEIGGHSLGGALAILILREMEHVNHKKVHTAAVFGTPSPFSLLRGPEEDKLPWTHNLTRYVNGNDIVPSMLNWRQNYHVGQEIQLGRPKWQRWYAAISDHNMARYVESMNEIIVASSRGT